MTTNSSARPAAAQQAEMAPRAAITPTDISLAAPAEPVADLAAMKARFAADFAAGLVAGHRDGGPHRPQVLHRLTDDGIAT